MEEPEARSLMGSTERELSLMDIRSGFGLAKSLMGSTARGRNLMGTIA